MSQSAALQKQGCDVSRRKLNPIALSHQWWVICDVKDEEVLPLKLTMAAVDETNLKLRDYTPHTLTPRTFVQRKG